MNRSTIALLSAVLIPSLVGLTIPVRAAEATAALSGSIFRADDQSPLGGAKLHAGDPKTGQLFSSAPAGEDGGFVLGDLPAATYKLAVEADGGLYTVETPLALVPGAARTLNLAVTPQPLNRDGAGAPPGEGLGEDEWSLWDNPLTAALAGLGIATVVGLAVWGTRSSSSSSSGVVPSPTAPPN